MFKQTEQNIDELINSKSVKYTKENIEHNYDQSTYHCSQVINMTSPLCFRHLKNRGQKMYKIFTKMDTVRSNSETYLRRS